MTNSFLLLIVRLGEAEIQWKWGPLVKDWTGSYTWHAKTLGFTLYTKESAGGK